MKRLRVYEYEIWGSVCEWPVVVDLSQNTRSGAWTLYFRYVDPEARHAVNVSAQDASEVYAALVDNNSSVLEFADALDQTAKDAENPASLMRLASELRNLPRADTDGGED